MFTSAETQRLVFLMDIRCKRYAESGGTLGRSAREGNDRERIGLDIFCYSIVSIARCSRGKEDDCRR